MSEIFTPASDAQIGDQRPALVLDTNTVLALWMFRDPALDALRDWIEAGNCRLYSREDALEELRRVLAYRQFGLTEEKQAQLHADYCGRLTPWADPPQPDREQWISSLPRCQDSDDQKFLEITTLSGAQALLTRDKALLRLNEHRRIRCSVAILPPDRLFPRTQTT